MSPQALLARSDRNRPSLHNGVNLALTMERRVIQVFVYREVISLDVSKMQASPPQPVGSLWPHLPDSFKLGVSGACTGVGAAGGVSPCSTAAGTF
jgi:hypothetical protein